MVEILQAVRLNIGYLVCKGKRLVIGVFLANRETLGVQDWGTFPKLKRINVGLLWKGKFTKGEKYQDGEFFGNLHVLWKSKKGYASPTRGPREVENNGVTRGPPNHR